MEFVPKLSFQETSHERVEGSRRKERDRDRDRETAHSLIRPRILRVSSLSSWWSRSSLSFFQDTFSKCLNIYTWRRYVFCSAVDEGPTKILADTSKRTEFFFLVLISIILVIFSLLLILFFVWQDEVRCDISWTEKTKQASCSKQTVVERTTVTNSFTSRASCKVHCIRNSYKHHMGRL